MVFRRGKSRLVEAAYQRSLIALEALAAAERRQLRAQHGLGRKQILIAPVTAAKSSIILQENTCMDKDLEFINLLNSLHISRKPSVMAWNVCPKEYTENRKHENVIFHM